MTDDTSLAETWRAVPGYEGAYEVSDLGRVRTMDRFVACGYGSTRRLSSQLLACRSHRSDGRRCAILSVNRKARTKLVAHLVLAAFVGPRPPGMWALHNDGDQTNVRLANLRWGTPTDNSYDRVRHGTDAKRNRTRCPRGHLLVEPNLYPGLLAKGHRNCLTCKRIKDRHRHHALKHGRVYDLDTEMRVFYARIMGQPVA